MAFTSLLALVALAAIATAAPTAVCPDGTRVSNQACCAFIPVCTERLPMGAHVGLLICLQLAQDLQNTLFMGDCGEDGKGL